MNIPNKGEQKNKHFFYLRRIIFWLFFMLLWIFIRRQINCWKSYKQSFPQRPRSIYLLLSSISCFVTCCWDHILAIVLFTSIFKKSNSYSSWFLLFWVVLRLSTTGFDFFLCRLASLLGHDESLRSRGARLWIRSSQVRIRVVRRFILSVYCLCVKRRDG